MFSIRPLHDVCKWSVISGLSGNTQGICLYFKGCYSSIYRVCDMSCFESSFLSRAFRNLKKTLESQAIENLLELWQKKKTKRFFPITKYNLKNGVWRIGWFKFNYFWHPTFDIYSTFCLQQYKAHLTLSHFSLETFRFLPSHMYCLITRISAFLICAFFTAVCFYLPK